MTEAEQGVLVRLAREAAIWQPGKPVGLTPGLIVVEVGRAGSSGDPDALGVLEGAGLAPWVDHCSHCFRDFDGQPGCWVKVSDTEGRCGRCRERTPFPIRDVVDVTPLFGIKLKRWENADFRPVPEHLQGALAGLRAERVA